MARRNKTPGRKVFTTKHLIGWLPTGSRMEKYGKTANKCVQCGDDETNDHLFSCPRRWRENEELVISLYEYLEKIKTDTSLRAAMVTGMSYHLQVTNPAINDPRCLVSCACAESQRQMDGTQ